MNLPEPVIKHSVGVAKMMAEYARTHGQNPYEFYVIGLLHDIGKLYPGDPCTNNRYKGHPRKGGELLKKLGFNFYKDVMHHGHPEDGYFSYVWLILNLADISINGKGEMVPIPDRLDRIGTRYGKDSEEYRHIEEIINILIQNNIISSDRRTIL